MEIVDRMFRPGRTIQENLADFAQLEKLALIADKAKFSLDWIELTKNPKFANITMCIDGNVIPSAGSSDVRTMLTAMSATGQATWQVRFGFGASHSTVSNSAIGVLLEKHDWQQSLTAAGILKTTQDTVQRENALAVLQAVIRTWVVSGTIEHSTAMVPILRNEDCSHWLGKEGREVYLMPDGWREIPAPVSGQALKGSNKEVTNRDEHYVVLTRFKEVKAVYGKPSSPGDFSLMYKKSTFRNLIHRITAPHKNAALKSGGIFVLRNCVVSATGNCFR